MTNIEFLKASELHFDKKNPRLVEYSITNETDENTIVSILWQQMGIEELVMSILAHGFFETEPMYAIEEKGKKVIVEGNRRLAAVKLILNPKMGGVGMEKYISKTTDKITDQLTNHLPVIMLKDRQDAWRYIGFKHVNGAAKWGSFAKAEYIAMVHSTFDIPLDQIAIQIGDNNKTVKKLFQGLMVLREADAKTAFDSKDIPANKLPFSHLYTAITYPIFRDYLSIDEDYNSETPVPVDNISKLEEVMFWIFGSKTKKIEPVVRSQNPNLRQLMSVLANEAATVALRQKNDLALALELSIGGEEVLRSALVDAKIALQKSLSKIGDYDGNDDLLKLAGTVANSSDRLYDQMKNIYDEASGTKDVVKRISEE